MLPVHTVLFPTDFSDPSLSAFPVACSLARDIGARLVILYVVPPPLGHDELEVRRDPEHYYQGLWKSLRDLQPPDGSIAVEHRLEVGEAETVILQVARETKAGLIVLGTHGRTGLSHLLMGSVAEQVVRKAPCPVLTLRTPFPIKAGEGANGPGTVCQERA
jgi:nucleotide-binding universal stress UspA family protein